MRSWAHVVVAAVLLISVCAFAQSPDVIVLTNITVVDTRFGESQPNMTVVIKNGRIAAVARHGLIDEGRHTQIINATGKFLIPGLWDMHVHSAGGPATWDEQIIYPLYIANGVTGIRDMGGDLSLLEERRGRILRGELVGPHMVIAGPLLSVGKNDPQTIVANSQTEDRAAVRQLKELGVDFVKIQPDLSRESYFAIADEAHKLKLPLAGHLPESVSALEASDAGQHSIEQMAGIILGCSSQDLELRARRLTDLSKRDFADYEKAGMEAMATYDRDKARAMFIGLANNSTYQVPTLSWWRTMANLDEERSVPDPRLRYVPASARSQWAQDPVHDHVAESDNLKKVSERLVQLAGLMHRAGIPFMAGTDSPDLFVFPGFSLHDELELMVQAGFTNLEALQSATFYPALFQARLDRYGVVERGRDADLVLLDANPLEDIRNTRKISMVIIGGNPYDRRQLDRMLSHVAELAGAQNPAQHASEAASARPAPGSN